VPQSFKQWTIGHGLQELLDGFQARAVFQAIPSEEWFGVLDFHDVRPGVTFVVKLRNASYTATNPRNRCAMVDKSRKVAAHCKEQET
jgi:hypothetical protein